MKQDYDFEFAKSTFIYLFFTGNKVNKTWLHKFTWPQSIPLHSSDRRTPPALPSSSITFNKSKTISAANWNCQASRLGVSWNYLIVTDCAVQQDILMVSHTHTNSHIESHILRGYSFGFDPHPPSAGGTTEEYLSSYGNMSFSMYVGKRTPPRPQAGNPCLFNSACVCAPLSTCIVHL